MEFNNQTVPPPMKEVVKEQRQVTIVEALKMAIDKYATFSGRSSRSEYWWWALATTIISCILAPISDWLCGIFYLAILVPSIALVCRRLHDIGKGAGWIFISLIPIIGGLILLYFVICPSEGPNRFGPVPNCD